MWFDFSLWIRFGRCFAWPNNRSKWFTHCFAYSPFSDVGAWCIKQLLVVSVCDEPIIHQLWLLSKQSFDGKLHNTQSGPITNTAPLGHASFSNVAMMSPVNWKHRRKLPSSIDGKNRMLKMLNAISIVIWRYFSVRFFWNQIRSDRLYRNDIGRVCRLVHHSKSIEIWQHFSSILFIKNNTKNDNTIKLWTVVGFVASFLLLLSY